MPLIDWKIDYKMSYFFSKFFKNDSYDVELFHTIRTDINRARNTIIEKFLNWVYTHLLFLDDDNPPESPYFLERMLKADKDIVTALIPSRQKAKIWEWYKWEAHRLCIFYDKMEEWMYWYSQFLNIPEWPSLFEIANCWMWCVLIKREVVEAVAKKYESPCEMWYKYYYKIWDDIIREDDIDIYALKDWILRYKKWISEDLLFFERAVWLWYTIWADKTIWCTHDNITIKEHIIEANKGLPVLAKN